MAKSVHTLKKVAREGLQKNFLPPARYGTAFHITPPVGDVRTLPAEDFTAATTPQESPHTLAPFDFDATDTYLLWHLAHLARLGVQVYVVPAGERRRLVLRPRGGRISQVICCVLQEGAKVTVADTVCGSELGLRRVIIHQYQGSELTWWSLRTANRFLNEKITVYLRGAGASVQVRHVVLEREHHQAD